MKLGGWWFWRCYLKKKKIVFDCLVGKIWGYGVVFFVVAVTFFVSYTLMAFSAPSTSANFPGLGWQKGGFAEDSLLLWI
jgi:hypothetical protein